MKRNSKMEATGSTQTAPPPRRGSRVKGFLIGCCLALVVLAIVVSAFLTLALFGSVSSFTTGSTSSFEEIVVREADTSQKIATIDIHGLILESGFSEQGIAAADTILTQLEAAEADPDVVAIIWDIDSPGGAVVASSRLFEAITAAAKPTVALFSGEVAASGAVYAAAGADKIISHPETLTGSIGVLAEFLDLSELLAKYGIKFNTIKSGQFKDIGSFSREMTDAERTMVQSLIDESYQRFVAALVQGRKLDENRVRVWADGRIFSGATAKDLELVDELGGLDAAVNAALELAGVEQARIIKYEEPFSLRSLLSFFSVRLGNTDPLAIVNRLEQEPALRLFYVME